MWINTAHQLGEVHLQGAYKSGKPGRPGNVREFVILENSGKSQGI